MNISTLINRLKNYKKQYGDIEVMIDQKSCVDNFEGEAFHFEGADTRVEKMQHMNMDTMRISKRKYNTLVIYPENFK